jgi:alpha-tubulin suppressor-like RCC1 family protein
MSTCALNRSGVAYCWGRGHWGTLGNPSVRAADSPDPVPVATTRRYAAIAVNMTNRLDSPRTACALTAAGEADCWGSSPQRLIGPGEECPGIGFGQPPTECVYSPQRVAPELRFRRLALGEAHICGLLADSTAVCWGRGSEGQLGNGKLEWGFTPQPVAGGMKFVDLSAGEHTTCALDASGAAYCWGINNSGELGDGTLTRRESPTRVVFSGAFRMIKAAPFGTCALTTGGEVYCWGSTTQRKMGVSITETRSPLPMLVALPVPSRTISAGLLARCATGDDSIVRCWGNNRLWQTGTKDPARCEVNRIEDWYCSPGPVEAPTLAEISGGALHHCGRATDGIVHCWGWNAEAQVGPPRLPGVVERPRQVPIPDA